MTVEGLKAGAPRGRIATATNSLRDQHQSPITTAQICLAVTVPFLKRQVCGTNSTPDDQECRCHADMRSHRKVYLLHMWLAVLSCYI